MTILHPALRLPPEAEPPPWREEAACRDEPSASCFFPGGDRGQTLAMTNAARKVCNGCAVKIDCLLYAIETQQEYGVWGGANEPQRRRLRRKLRNVRSAAAMIEVIAASV